MRTNGIVWLAVGTVFLVSLVPYTYLIIQSRIFSEPYDPWKPLAIMLPIVLFTLGVLCLYLWRKAVRN